MRESRKTDSGLPPATTPGQDTAAEDAAGARKTRPDNEFLRPLALRQTSN